MPILFMYKLIVNWKYVTMNYSNEIHIYDKPTYFAIINKYNSKEKNLLIEFQD